MVNEIELKKALLDVGLNLSSFCDATGIKRTSLHRYLKGETSPSAEKVLLMSKVLGIEDNADKIKLIFLN